jgi:hypothetical protein
MATNTESTVSAGQQTWADASAGHSEGMGHLAVSWQDSVATGTAVPSDSVDLGTMNGADGLVSGWPAVDQGVRARGMPSACTTDGSPDRREDGGEGLLATGGILAGREDAGTCEPPTSWHPGTGDPGSHAQCSGDLSPGFRAPLATDMANIESSADVTKSDCAISEKRMNCVATEDAHIGAPADEAARAALSWVSSTGAGSNVLATAAVEEQSWSAPREVSIVAPTIAAAEEQSWAPRGAAKTGGSHSWPAGAAQIGGSSGGANDDYMGTHGSDPFGFRKEMQSGQQTAPGPELAIEGGQGVPPRFQEAGQSGQEASTRAEMTVGRREEAGLGRKSDVLDSQVDDVPWAEGLEGGGALPLFAEVTETASSKAGESGGGLGGRLSKVASIDGKQQRLERFGPAARWLMHGAGKAATFFAGVDGGTSPGSKAENADTTHDRQVFATLAAAAQQTGTPWLGKVAPANANPGRSPVRGEAATAADEVSRLLGGAAKPRTRWAADSSALSTSSNAGVTRTLQTAAAVAVSPIFTAVDNTQQAAAVAGSSVLSSPSGSTHVVEHAAPAEERGVVSPPLSSKGPTLGPQTSAHGSSQFTPRCSHPGPPSEGALAAHGTGSVASAKPTEAVAQRPSPAVCMRGSPRWSTGPLAGERQHPHEVAVSAKQGAHLLGGRSSQIEVASKDENVNAQAMTGDTIAGRWRQHHTAWQMEGPRDHFKHDKAVPSKTGLHWCSEVVPVDGKDNGGKGGCEQHSGLLEHSLLEPALSMGAGSQINGHGPEPSPTYHSSSSPTKKGPSAALGEDAKSRSAHSLSSLEHMSAAPTAGTMASAQEGRGAPEGRAPTLDLGGEALPQARNSIRPATAAGSPSDGVRAAGSTGRLASSPRGYASSPRNVASRPRSHTLLEREAEVQSAGLGGSTGSRDELSSSPRARIGLAFESSGLGLVLDGDSGVLDRVDADLIVSPRLRFDQAATSPDGLAAGRGPGSGHDPRSDTLPGLGAIASLSVSSRPVAGADISSGARANAVMGTGSKEQSDVDAGLCASLHHVHVSDANDWIDGRSKKPSLKFGEELQLTSQGMTKANGAGGIGSFGFLPETAIQAPHQSRYPVTSEINMDAADILVICIPCIFVFARALGEQNKQFLCFRSTGPH